MTDQMEEQVVTETTRRFPLGQLVFAHGSDLQLGSVDLKPYLERHANGDWGESEYPDENETAVREGGVVMSLFRTPSGVRFWLVTWGARNRTTALVDNVVPLEPHDVWMKLTCIHVGTGRAAELPPPGTHELYGMQLRRNRYAVPLRGRRSVEAGGDGEQSASRLIKTIVDSPESNVTMKHEQFLRAIWRACETVDFRPIDHKGRRVSGTDRSPDGQRRWKDSADDCERRGIVAWFELHWEHSRPLEILLLPEVMKTYLAYKRLMATLGFEASALSCEVKDSSEYGLTPGQPLLVAVLRVPTGSFSYVLGTSIENVETELRHADDVWDRTSRNDRNGFMQGMKVNQPEHSMPIVEGIEATGIQVPLRFVLGLPSGHVGSS